METDYIKNLGEALYIACLYDLCEKIGFPRFTFHIPPIVEFNVEDPKIDIIGAYTYINDARQKIYAAIAIPKGYLKEDE